ncbi:MAG: hypothetical protein RSE38_12620, partial [Acinetobacter sp.]
SRLHLSQGTAGNEVHGVFLSAKRTSDHIIPTFLIIMSDIQRQRDHQLAQYLAHGKSPPIS